MADTAPTTFSTLANLIGNLAWPAVTLFIVFKFRTQLAGLLTRLGSVKLAGSEFVFQEPISKAPEPTSKQKKAELQIGPDGFLTVSSLHNIVDESGLLSANESIRGELLIFQTPGQRTWLLATNRRLFVVLDDAGTRATSRLIQTYFDINRTLPVKCRKDEAAMIVKFAAEDTWWYYSSHLFATPQALKDAVARLIGS